MNVAARLCAKAAPGQIVISQSTYLRVKSRVKAEQLPPMELKGVTFRVEAFEVKEVYEHSIAPRG